MVFIWSNDQIMTEKSLSHLTGLARSFLLLTAFYRIFTSLLPDYCRIIPGSLPDRPGREFLADRSDRKIFTGFLADRSYRV